MGFIAGIDGGGTKTKVLVKNLNDNVLTSATFGALNLNGADAEVVSKTLSDCAAFIDKTAGGIANCRCACVASAGISNSLAVQLLTQSLNSLGLKDKFILKGDHEAALAGALSLRDGAVIIAGTGSICIGKSGNKTVRSGGYGHIIDDEGSGYAIGRDVLAAVIRSLDGRSAPTVMTGLVMDKIGAENIGDIIKFVYSKETTKKDIAGFSPFFDIALHQGEEAAINILQKASTELFLLANTVLRQLDNTKEISFLGSVLTNSKAIHRALSEKLCEKTENIIITNPENDAATGAVLLAQKFADEQRA